jgi:hypothetical protein
MTAAPATSAATFSLRTRFVDDQRAAEELLSIEGRDDLFGFRVIANLGEAEAARLAGKTVSKQGERIGLDAYFGKQCSYVFLCGLERQIAHVQFLHGTSPCAPMLRAGT